MRLADSELFQAITGTLLFLAFFAAGLISAILRRFIDPTALRAQDDKGLIRSMNSWLISPDLLTPTGRILWTTRNWLFVAVGLLVVVILILK